jgi:hypothetical protein
MRPTDPNQESVSTRGIIEQPLRRASNEQERGSSQVLPYIELKQGWHSMKCVMESIRRVLHCEPTHGMVAC